MDLKNCNPVSTPGEKDEDKEGEQELLSKEEATRYRGNVARANYLAQDRTDIQYAVKELSRKMSAPDYGDLRRMKRLARYLVGRTRYVMEFHRQESGDIKVCVDTDYA